MTRLELQRNFAFTLEQQRVKLGLTQKQMAEELEISESGYRKILRGDVEKIDLYTAYKLHTITGMWIYEMINIHNEHVHLIDGLRCLSARQRKYIYNLVLFEISFNEQNKRTGDNGDYVSMIVPTGNFTDGMSYDSMNIEHVEVSRYRPEYGSLITSAVKVTSNHFHPVYHEGDVLLVCNDPPREGDTGIFINTKKSRAYIRKFRQSDPCRLESLILPGVIPDVLVDKRDEEDMSQWVKFGYVLTKIR